MHTLVEAWCGLDDAERLQKYRRNLLMGNKQKENSKTSVTHHFNDTFLHNFSLFSEAFIYLVLGLKLLDDLTPPGG